MAEIRKDPVIDRWVIISSERGKRPRGNPPPSEAKKRDGCPFCYGSEDKTPPEIMAVRPDNSGPDSPGWKVRVVPNKFPALSQEGKPERLEDGLFNKMAGVGAHEVIIENPEHSRELADLDYAQVEEIIRAYQSRVKALEGDPRLRYIAIFKNRGETAGATLEHPHTQLLATPIVPALVEEELKASADYFIQYKKCVYCELLEQTLKQKTRVIMENEGFAAVAAFAPIVPYETLIFPKQHCSRFEELKDNGIKSLAQILRDSLRLLDTALNFPPFNFYIHTSPIRGDYGRAYHWHIEILPRLTKFAGFELGTGIFVNPVLPEDAAALLRETRHPENRN